MIYICWFALKIKRMNFVLIKLLLLLFIWIYRELYLRKFIVINISKIIQQYILAIDRLCCETRLIRHCLTYSFDIFIFHNFCFLLSRTSFGLIIRFFRLVPLVSLWFGGRDIKDFNFALLYYLLHLCLFITRHSSSKFNFNFLLFHFSHLSSLS